LFSLASISPNAHSRLSRSSLGDPSYVWIFVCKRLLCPSYFRTSYLDQLKFELSLYIALRDGCSPDASVLRLSKACRPWVLGAKPLLHTRIISEGLEFNLGSLASHPLFAWRSQPHVEPSRCALAVRTPSLSPLPAKSKLFPNGL
jgi:hypothetical protein